MAKKQFVIESGTVKTFDRRQARGEVLVGARTVPFDSTSFHSGRPTRFPTPGEPVEVLFDAPGDTLLGVRVPQKPLHHH